MPDPTPRTQNGPVWAAYQARLGQGDIVSDTAQADAVQVLDHIAGHLSAKPPLAHRLGLISRPRPVAGAYLWGEVGRGKTLLMDLFFEAVPVAQKRRLHFHQFMDEIHSAIAAFRTAHRDDPGRRDPIPHITAPILKSTRLLCLDEFRVNDITNAMLLSRLFSALFEGGLTLVATSNVAPDHLYWNGLNRALFLPFIALLRDNTQIVHLMADEDYRLEKLKGEPVFAFGTGPEVDAQMDHIWDRLTDGATAAPQHVTSLGRQIEVPRAAGGMARFSFAQLCETPLGARDYLRLTEAFDGFVVDHVPQFTRSSANAAKRFILFIDMLYDGNGILCASFAAPLDRLTVDDENAFAFQRCLSRLHEMQSAAYLAAGPRAESGA